MSDSNEPKIPKDAPLSGGAITLTTEQLLHIVETARQNQTSSGHITGESSQENTINPDANSPSEGAGAATNPASDTYTESADVMATWDASLTDNPGELNALRDLGLGVAIDITAKHPWERKSTYQAKQVTFDDLIVINESNKYRKSKEQVETYTAIQADLESGFRPDATKPIHVTIAADAHRSSSRSKTIDSKTILTRTVAFRARDPASREQKLEDFEEKLKEWLKKQGCSKYDKTTTIWCIQYLNELGGVTHYVSSITLGATKYHVSLNSTLFTSLSASSGLKAESFVTSSVKTKATSKVFQFKQKQHHIGRVPDDSKEGRIINFRTKAEAVVKCSYTSLANLVSDPTLRKILERGINEYIDFKKNGIRGPYVIATAELLQSKDSSGKETRRRLYWKVAWDAPFTGKKRQSSTAADSNSELAQQKTASSTDSNDQDTCLRSAIEEEVLEFVGSAFYIGYTPDKGKASNFYLRPIIQSSSKEDRYFHIVTDPDDSQSDCIRERKKQMNADQVDSDSPPPIELNSPSAAASLDLDQLDELEPQRYVSVVDDKLVAGLNLKHLKKGSVFKLKHLHEDVTQPLSQSQWLPEALRGSQPHIICRQGNTLRSKFIKGKLMSVYINMEKDRKERLLSYGKHVEGNKRYSYFILEHGH